MLSNPERLLSVLRSSLAANANIFGQRQSVPDSLTTQTEIKIQFYFAGAAHKSVLVYIMLTSRIQGYLEKHNPALAEPLSQVSSEKISHSDIDKLNTSADNREQLHNILTLLNINVPGLGLARIRKFGIRSRKDALKKIELLPTESQIHLRENPQRVSSALVAQFESSLKSAHVWFTIAGSYRRGAKELGDIDIITLKLGELRQQLAKYQLKIYADGPTKLSGVVVFKKHKIKIDVFQTTKKECPFMLLYLTGSKQHNIIMRSVAKRKGYKLNHLGLFNLKTGRSVPLKTEEDIFKFLGMKYISPPER